jgi:signal transduction histidine kinase/serine phosphatase RsbU (regulator of sigma subunit)/DNA-binding NarL/FixJ family response regulator/anti-sigma regulatory factor (Ser/Thr protein kinase)
MNLRLKTLLASSLATIVLITGLSVGLSYLIVNQIMEVEKRSLARRFDQVLQAWMDEANIHLNRPRQPDAGGEGQGAPNDEHLPPPPEQDFQRLPRADVGFLRDSAGRLTPFDLRPPGAPEHPEAASFSTSAVQGYLKDLPAHWVGLPFDQIPNLSPGTQIGILQTPQGLLLITERPWSHPGEPEPDDSEPLRLFTAVRLTEREVQRLGRRAHIDTYLLPLTAPEVPDELRNPATGTVRVVRDLSADQSRPSRTPPNGRPQQREATMLANYALLRDVHGKPVAVLETIAPNPFVQRGAEGSRTLIGFIWTAGLAFGVVLNLLLDRWVISRVSSLSGQLRQVQGDYRDSSRVVLPGSDELGTLAEDINAMLRRLVDWKELEEKNREVSALNAELQRLNQLKDEFLANTSHELRTPLNGMIGIASSMLDGATGPLSEEQQYNLTLLTQSGKRLTNLVNDILDFSRLRHHELSLDVKPVSLRAMVEMTLQLDRALVGAKDVRLINNISISLPPVQADENRLQQILHNLIGNAIKFTHVGAVSVSARIIGDGEQGYPAHAEEPFVAISVTDTGIGIPEDKWERVFESFEQVEGSARREYGGTGLGLAITRNLVELHGGQIWVTSRPGEGATFTFTLPVSTVGDVAAIVVEPAPVPTSQEDTPALTPSEPLPARATDTFAPHVLIVDDEPVNLQVVKNFLSFEKYNLTLASDGHEALALLEQGLKPDIILLDVMMPHMTGYEVIQVIREKVKADRLPIILLSARNQPEDIVLGLEVGANDYLTKPISKEELVARIHTHLQIRQLEEETIRITIAHERQLAQFLDALPVGVSVHNPDTSLFYLNQMARQLLVSDGQEKGKVAPLAADYPIYKAGTGIPYPLDRLPIVRALEGERSQADDLEVHLDETIVPLEVVGTPIRDEQGDIVYAIAAFQDITERRRAEQVTARLQEEMVSRQKLESELGVAAHIQRSMVPEIVGGGDPHRRYALDALFLPARSVGGDLYDFFLLGEDRLCMVIGDVADKGVPAALLMARTVTLIRMLARRTSTPVEILEAANQELCLNNPECLFVTLFCGILDLATGAFRYASAGHDAPVLRRDRGAGFLDLETGPPLGLDENAVFPEQERPLYPDDLVVFYTDGITEARNRKGVLFSEERLRVALEDEGTANPSQAVQAIQRHHDAFVKGAPQSDDLTLLVLQFLAPVSTVLTMMPGDWTMALGSELAELEKVKARLEAFSKETGLAKESIEDAQLIVEEVLVNIIQYGYGSETSHPIDLAVTLTPEYLQMTFRDRGTPFNPLTDIEEPDLEAGDEERSSGGMGFHLVRALSDHIDYQHQDGQNILVVHQPLHRK